MEIKEKQKIKIVKEEGNNQDKKQTPPIVMKKKILNKIKIKKNSHL